MSSTICPMCKADALTVGHREPHGDGVTAAYPERGEAFVRQGDIQARLCVFIQHDEAEAVARGDLAHTGRMPQNADGVKIHANAAP